MTQILVSCLIKSGAEDEKSDSKQRQQDVKTKVSAYKDLPGKKMVVQQSSLNSTKDEAEVAAGGLRTAPRNLSCLAHAACFFI